MLEPCKAAKQRLSRGTEGGSRGWLKAELITKCDQRGTIAQRVSIAAVARNKRAWHMLYCCCQGCRCSSTALANMISDILSTFGTPLGSVLAHQQRKRYASTFGVAVLEDVSPRAIDHAPRQTVFYRERASHSYPQRGRGRLEPFRKTRGLAFVPLRGRLASALCPFTGIIRALPVRVHQLFFQLSSHFKPHCAAASAIVCPLDLCAI